MEMASNFYRIFQYRKMCMYLMVFVSSLHKGYTINAQSGNCLSVCMFHLRKYWSDFEKIWY